MWAAVFVRQGRNIKAVGITKGSTDLHATKGKKGTLPKREQTAGTIRKQNGTPKGVNDAKKKPSAGQVLTATNDKGVAKLPYICKLIIA